MATVSFRHAARHVTYVDVELDGAADTAKFLLTSDEHLDNVQCNQGMFKKHLDRAVAEDAHIINNGDMLCLMEGKYDRRSDRTHLRPEMQGNDYLDAVIRYAAGFLEPYAKRFIVIGRGNHETAILKHHQTDMTERLVGVLNDRTGSTILSGGYSGWILFRCKRSSQQHTIKMYRHHGFGGASPVTRGVIATNRMATYLPDANIVMTGHTHTEWVVPIARQRINSHGTLTYDEQLHVRIPGYKCGMGDGFEGWEVEKGFAPLTNGSMMLTIGFDGGTLNGQPKHRFTYDVARLK